MPYLTSGVWVWGPLLQDLPHQRGIWSIYQGVLFTIHPCRWNSVFTATWGRSFLPTLDLPAYPEEGRVRGSRVLPSRSLGADILATGRNMGKQGLGRARAWKWGERTKDWCPLVSDAECLPVGCMVLDKVSASTVKWGK